MCRRWGTVGFIGCLLAVVVFVGCRRPLAAPTIAELDAAAQAAVEDEEFQVGPGITHGNLTIFPIVSRTPRDQDRFITLDEGLAAGTVEVRELGASQPVPNDNPFGGDPTPDPNAAPQIDIPAPQSDAPERDPSLINRTGRSLFRAIANAVMGSGREESPADPFVDDEASDQTVENEPAQQVPAQQAVQIEDGAVVEQRRQQAAVPAARNQVNQVVVINRSEKPLYLMPGEIILGGDQDRTIGQELVIAADGKETPIQVFCVEHGRWGGKGNAETVAQLAALADDVTVARNRPQASEEELMQQAEEADKGKFVISAGALSKGARLAAQDKAEQGEVWNAVAEANAVRGVQSRSGAFTGQYVEASAVKRLEPYIEALLEPIESESQVVGVIVAINGKVESFDIFESTPLFKKLWPKLLKSYAVDAAQAAQPGETPAACEQAVARQFLQDAMEAQVAETKDAEGLAIEKRDSDKVLLFTARDVSGEPVDAQEAAPAAFGGGGFGGSVHGFGAAK